MFPANSAGIALAILRCCVAFHAALAFPLMNGMPALLRVLLIAIIVLALAVGAFTPAGCVGCVLLQASALHDQSRSTVWSLVVPLVLPIVLLLLGPGAYSLDAKRYGRRVIFSPRR